MAHVNPERDATQPTLNVEALLFDNQDLEQSLRAELVRQLTPERFMDLLADHRDAYCDDEAPVLAAIEKFAGAAKVEFLEPTTPEEELSRHVVSVEADVSSFIESRLPLRSLSLLSIDELEQLAEIYNPTNLLYLAKALSSEDGLSLSPVQGDMLFRYRNVLSQIDHMRNEVEAAEMRELQGNIGAATVGYRTWAGDLHPYGVEQRGRIVTDEFRDFSEKEDDGRSVVTVGGVPVRVSIRNTGVI